MFRLIISKLLRKSNRLVVNSSKLFNDKSSKIIVHKGHKTLVTVISESLNPSKLGTLKTLLAINILSWLGFNDDDEKKESELIMILKRAVLSTNREEFSKAEKLLHLALRIAQQQQHEQGITYCYDLMANLAFNQLELDKARKLFVSVQQRLLSTGTPENDLKVIHISLKLSRICHLQAENETADIGYNWCLEKIKSTNNNDIDTMMLNGVIHDWYAQFLLDTENVAKSLIHLNQAYNICKQVKGDNSEQTMLLLNDLATTYWRMDDLNNALSCLSEASSIGSKLEDQSHVGVINANLGLLHLQKGMIDEAKKCCEAALYIGNQYQNEESISQAKYCFDQIKMNFATSTT
ncbi:hypothetical protein FQA39_LY13096 [Lamprigera yunnana]|nr:hypothetical protein FQA39_LY13096 [Lamprigera yunnana]